MISRRSGLLVITSGLLVLSLLGCQGPNFAANPFSSSQATQVPLPAKIVTDRVTRQNTAKDQVA